MTQMLVSITEECMERSDCTVLDDPTLPTRDKPPSNYTKYKSKSLNRKYAKTFLNYFFAISSRAETMISGCF